ncbi:DNA recombination protein RmuC [bacterium]|nr:DNA recombination protein RmuC [bacterium]|tara:strand:- start:10870 stop:11919 length:1050 start_codon:yes stop_codon:yes gene_type:complete
MTSVTMVLIGLAVIIGASNLLILWYFIRSTRKAKLDNGVDFLQKEIHGLRDLFDRKIGDSTRDINESMREQLRSSQKVVGDVTEKLTRLEETNKQVVSFTEQLRQLQDVLKNPKQRGILGEYYLESVLQNVLPPDSFRMQYSFTDKEIVDAVVFVKDKVVPIDSKFSLENYNRMVEAKDETERVQFEKSFVNDLKLRITETSKYIRPEEGTTEFAFMFIPSEGIYYELLSNKVGTGNESLIQRAAGTHKVIIVSPTSFLAYLQTVLQGLKAMDIEEKAKDIIKNVSKLGKHIEKYDDYYEKLGNSLSTTVNHYNAGYKELSKVDKDVLRITGTAPGIEIESIEKPNRED